MQAGCFVLVSNLDNPKDLENFSAGALLRLYKNQDGIERNFSFLKDQVIVNSIFLKKNHRIEVLGVSSSDFPFDLASGGALYASPYHRYRQYHYRLEG